MSYVYDFDEQADGGRELLGGKGIGLAEMTQLGVPVPAGFTITTEACRAYWTDGRQPAGRARRGDRRARRAPRAARPASASATRTIPLLVSVRSGRGRLDARDDGHDPQPRPERRGGRGARAATGNERFAYDSYRRLIQMYGEVVDGIDGAPLRAGAERPEAGARRRSRTSSSTADDLAELVGDVRVRSTRPRRAVRSRRTRASSCAAPSAPSSTRGTRRARRSTARAHGIPDDLGTAVNVVQMVFGNKGDDSRRPASASRAIPATGERGPLRRVPRQRAGRGRRRRHPHAGAARGDAEARCPRPSTSSSRRCQRLEEHYRDMQDIEFTVEEGKLYLLQTRGAKRTAAAALRAAVDDGRGGPDHARGGGRAHRPRPARPAPAPDDRPGRALRRRAQRA